MPLRVVIADDHPIVLDGLAQLFAAGAADIEVVDRCAEGVRTLEVIREKRPDVAVVDIRMPGLNGLQILQSVRSENLPTRVVLLTAQISDDELLEAVRLSVGGVMLKEAASRVLLQCVRAVASGQQWLDDASLRRALEKMLRHEAGLTEVARALTPREIEVVSMIAAGLRNRQVAEKLSITEGTVKIHLHSIYQKLGISGRLELALFAREKGLG